MDIGEKNSKSRMKFLFTNYYFSLGPNGLSWVVKENEKIAVVQILSDIK